MDETYAIYDTRSGHQVACIDAAGIVSDEGDPQAIATVRRLLQREITVREPVAEADNEEYEPFPEEQMCYFGVVTLRPNDPGHFAAVLQRLPYVSYYEVRNT